MKQENSTLSGLDILKLIMSIIVVVGHIGGSSYPIALSYCAVPTFFIISVFLLGVVIMLISYL